jgi:uncharacterized protein (TIGR03435 family)
MRKLIVLLQLLVPFAAFAQVARAPLSFEVASVKPAELPTAASFAAGKLPNIGLSVSGSRVSIGLMSLAELIPMAYNVKTHQVSGPDWMRQQRFDITAKMPDGVTSDDIPEMLRALLEERFHLKVHHEMRDNPIYGLVVTKGGPKFKEASADSEPEPDPAETAASITLPGLGGQVRINPSQLGGFGARGGTGTISIGGDGMSMKMSMGQSGMHMDINRAAMPAFAEFLTSMVDRPVVDMTELRGRYQFVLDLPPEALISVLAARGGRAGIAIPANPFGGGRGQAGVAPTDASDPSSGAIHTALAQLGLKLEPRKAPTDFVVVDHVDKVPTEN